MNAGKTARMTAGVTRRSCLYVGSVMHRRLRPRRHHFRYRVFWILVDIDELAALSERLRWFSHNRANLFSFHDRDHGNGSPTPLREQIERKLREADVDCAGGAIRVLCMPRTLGYCFNPLSIFFCHRGDGALAALVYQVHNTFGERHSYVIPVSEHGHPLHQRCAKRFYVSPFLGMDVRYEFRVSVPDERVAVGIKASEKTGPVFTAVLEGRHRALSDSNLLALFVKMPAVTIKVIAAIHWQAAKLWIKRIALHRRPPPPAHDTSIVRASLVHPD